MVHHVPTLWMPILLHLHDPASIELAAKLLVTVPEQKAEDTDEEHWSGIRIVDETTGNCFASLRWVRGGPRDLEQAAKQLASAVSIRADDEMYKPRVPKANRAPRRFHDNPSNDYQRQQQGLTALRDELGIPHDQHRFRKPR